MMQPFTWSPRAIATKWRAALTEPARQTDLLQIVKAVLAAVAAWWLAHDVLDLAQPFLAPWAALLTVHATVYRTLLRGAQSVMATVLGITLAVAAAQAWGFDAATLGIVLLASYLVAQMVGLGAEATTAATTALIVLTTGVEDEQTMLLERFLDTALGVLVGVLVNLVVLPPLNRRSAEQQIDAIDRTMGDLMVEMSHEMRQTWTEDDSGRWIDRTRTMDDDLAHAWRLVRHARESDWWNPRHRLSRSRGVDHPETYEDVLRRLEDGIAQLRSIARTVDESTRSAEEWDRRFRDPWLDLLSDAGERVADPRANVSGVRERLDRLTDELSGEDLPGLLWPVYGSLITSLVNIIEIVDDVATARPVRP